MSRTIRTYPDEILRQRAEPVGPITDEVRELANQMVETLVMHNGYGLAAPQVGELRRLIVVDVGETFHVLLNPEVVATGEDRETMPEGCLSIPGVEAEVERPYAARVRARTLEDAPLELEAEGLLARVLQHEVDHLDGVLFLDHLGRVKRRQVLKEYERLHQEQGDSDDADTSSSASRVTA